MIAFGPVPSRRFGKSLGINNISTVKTCTYSCIYCQVGRTKDKTNVRRSFYDPSVVFKETSDHICRLAPEHMPDCITIVPNGEPTLDINLGVEIDLLKKFHLPVGVITNASLLFRTDVRDALSRADQVCVKVDSILEPTWRKINRPSKSLCFQDCLKGLKTFAESYQGRLFTETMIVDPVNDSEEEAHRTADFIAQLYPAGAFLLAPTRPTAEKDIAIPAKSRLQKAFEIFTGYGLKTELLIEFEGDEVGLSGNAFEDILDISAVHPIREDVALKILKGNPSGKYALESLISEQLIKVVTYQGKKYYVRDYHE